MPLHQTGFGELEREIGVCVCVRGGGGGGGGGGGQVSLIDLQVHKVDWPEWP